MLLNLFSSRPDHPLAEAKELQEVALYRKIDK